VVVRLHGQSGDTAAVLQPDGQLGWPNMLVPTDEPFVPLKAEALRDRLHKSPYAEYQVLTSAHYVIFYQSNLAFAEESARLLEDLYRGLIHVCQKHGIPVHESEFPLVAVIFATERDFRAHKEVDPEVQAYYELFTNRIFFYQRSDQDRHEPKLTALRKPQTVAHEGAHQILSNIGVQPRLSAWPSWLVEGLAEYCATPANTRKGIVWDRLGTINALHMATLRELDDPLSNQIGEAELGDGPASRERRLIQTESLMHKTRLTPTDYAQAWALTHYLAQKRGPDFVKFLKSMSQLPPLIKRTAEENVAEFHRFFADELPRLDRKVDDYIRRLSRQGNFDPLPYFAVMFAQPLGGGAIRRVSFVSQSPQLIQQKVQEMSGPGAEILDWQAVPFPTRAQAIFNAQQWTRGY
jgi:hypothetical protein